MQVLLLILVLSSWGLGLFWTIRVENRRRKLEYVGRLDKILGHEAVIGAVGRARKATVGISLEAFDAKGC